MKKYEKLAADIISLVGGNENINSLTHCMTRLRFKLKSEEKANEKALNDLEGVVSVIHSAGQFQVVVGTKVPFVYEEIQKITHLTPVESITDKSENKNPLSKIIDIISSCFSPMLSILCATGMIKGINALFLFLNIYSNTSGAYLIINAIGDSVFYFMPVFLGYNASKKFSHNPMVGIVIGLSLCYPSIQLDVLANGSPIGSLFGMEYFKTFLNIPLITNNYTGTVIPVLILVAVASQIQKLFKKILPEILQSFFVPFFVLLITLPIGFLTIGPVVSLLTNLLGDGLMAIQGWSPILFAVVAGFAWQALVVLGLHWCIVPIFLMNLANFGSDYIQPAIFSASFAQTAVVFGMYFKLKDKKIKQLCIPAIVSGLCGITEPAIYGITLPKKKPFVISLIGAAIGAGIAAFMGTSFYVMGGTGVFGFTSFISPNGSMYSVISAFIAVVCASLISFLLTFFLWKDEEQEKIGIEENEKNTIHEINIKSPVNGDVVPLESVHDEAFSKGLLGNGIAVDPSDGNIYSPINGTVCLVFPTKHAVGIISETGLELLIHIGLNTVELNGDGFTSFIDVGDTVKEGQLLISFDYKGLKDKNYILETPIVITNKESYTNILKIDNKSVQHGDLLFTVTV